MYYNIIKFAKWAHSLKGLFLLNLFLITSLLFTYIILFVRFNSLKFKSIFEEEGLDGEINSIPLAVDILLNRILSDIFIISKIFVDYITEYIICCRVISNNGFKKVQIVRRNFQSCGEI